MSRLVTLREAPARRAAARATQRKWGRQKPRHQIPRVAPDTPPTQRLTRPRIWQLETFLPTQQSPSKRATCASSSSHDPSSKRGLVGAPCPTALRAPRSFTGANRMLPCTLLSLFFRPCTPYKLPTCVGCMLYRREVPYFTSPAALRSACIHCRHSHMLNHWCVLQIKCLSAAPNRLREAYAMQRAQPRAVGRSAAARHAGRHTGSSTAERHACASRPEAVQTLRGDQDC